MKTYMMIIGAEIKSSGKEPGARDGVMEVTLVPLTVIKQKTPGFMDLMKGDMELIMKQAQGLVQHHTKHFISVGEWIDQGYKIAKHATLEMLPDDMTEVVQ